MRAALAYLYANFRTYNSIISPNITEKQTEEGNY